MPIASKGGAFWKKQVDLALAKRRMYEPWWEAALKAYAPTGESESFGNSISTNRTFTLVERKKADLFYQRPDVTLQPTGLTEAPPVVPGQPVPPSPLQAHEEIVNEKLGEDGVDATTMMDAVVFDILCHQGVGFTKMGYESITIATPAPPDPMTGQVPLGPDGQPLMVEVPIHEQCFWHHFSGKQAIIPATFRSTEWDKAPFLGMQFELPLTPGNRKKYKLPDDFQGSQSSQKQHYDHGTDSTAAESVFTGVELWYRSILFRDDVQHPEHLTQLVLVDGIEEPVIEVDSPHQTLDARGQLTPDSLIGNPIHPFSVRTLPDSAYVSSDGTMIRPLERELNVFRTQMVDFRDATVMRWGYRVSAMPKEVIAKIVRSPVGGMIGLPDEAFPLEQNLVELPHGSMPRESFLSNDYIDRDLAQTTAIDDLQAGAQGERRTATADQIQQANANARMEKERGILLKRYLKGVTKFSTLEQRYLPIAQAAQIVGLQRAQVWDQWRHQVPSALAFTAMPDSALRVDQAVDRKASIDLYSFLAADPFVNRKVLLEKLLRKHHLDPQKIVKDPDPPQPEQPKVSIAISSESLNPLLPEYGNVYQILTQQGYKNLSQPTIDPISATLLQQAQEQQAQADTRHGGKVAQAENLSKHASDRSGGMQGSGVAAPMGAAGGHIQ